jgi:hypothetical protein
MNNRRAAMIINHYLRENPHEIIIDCDTGRGKEIISTLWDDLIQNGYEYHLNAKNESCLTKTIKKKHTIKSMKIVKSYIFPNCV